MLNNIDPDQCSAGGIVDPEFLAIKLSFSRVSQSSQTIYTFSIQSTWGKHWKSVEIELITMCRIAFQKMICISPPKNTSSRSTGDSMLLLRTTGLRLERHFTSHPPGVIAHFIWLSYKYRVRLSASWAS